MSSLKNNPLLLAVLGVGAWYVLTQSKAASARAGVTPVYGQQGALINPGVRGYQVPPQVAQAAQKQSLVTAALNLGSALLGRAPAAAPVAGAPGGSLLAGYEYGGLTQTGYGTSPAVLTNMVGANNLTVPQLIGDYGWSDGQGIIDSYIGSSAPQLAWPQEYDVDPLGYF